MTLGEKLKEARRKADLSQEQLAAKLAVSRSAVAKWESDKGMPDVENLKAISALLNVSIDYLLDNGSVVCETVVREPIDLTNYGKGWRKMKKDRVVREKYPDANICTLLGEQKLEKSESIIGIVLGFITFIFGIPRLINLFKNMHKEFYLVEQNETYYLVTVTNEYIESRLIEDAFDDKNFEIGNWTYQSCGPILYAKRRSKNA